MHEDLREKAKLAALEYLRAVEKDTPPRSYIPPSGKKIGAEELAAMIDASLDMWLTAGRFNDEFESAFAKKLGVKFALSTNSGSSANLLALSALTSPKLGERALKKGDEVIAVAAGFPTTVNPIFQNGLIPVFVDCDPQTYNIRADKIGEAISPKTKAVFIAHTLGNPFDLDTISEICRKHNLWLIEDSCDALGAKYKGKYAGTYGHIGTFSFYPAHHITMGEGGAVITNDPVLHKIILSFRDWGRDCWCKPGRDDTCKNRFKLKRGNLPAGYDHKYTYSHIGYNLKITDWQAAVGVEQLKKLDSFIERRTQNAHYLLENLADLQKYLILPKTSPDADPSWFGFLISVAPDAPFGKQELVEYLEANGVGTRQLFAGNILRQPMITDADVELRIGAGSLRNSRGLGEADYAQLAGTEFIMNNSFWVGCFPALGERELSKTVATIREFAVSKSR